MTKKKTEQDLFPKWLALLEKHPNVEFSIDNIDNDRQYNMSIGSYISCMIGEAYDFRDDYCRIPSGHYCSECTRFAEDFLIKEYRLDQSYRQKFVDHWNKEHA